MSPISIENIEEVRKTIRRVRENLKMVLRTLWVEFRLEIRFQSADFQQFIQSIRPPRRASMKPAWSPD